MTNTNTFGFMREVVNAATGHTARPSGRNAQAVKVLLSEMYIKWLSDPQTSSVIDTIIHEVVAAARGAPALTGTSPSPSPAQPDHPSSAGSQSSAAPGNSSNYSASGGESRKTSLVPSTAGQADPSASPPPASSAELDTQRGSSPSPPPSPPMRQRAQASKKDVVVPDRTPSPVSQHHTRFLGVDELDGYAHRAMSPGGASPVSPNSALHGGAKSHQPQHHSVDPNIPLATHGGVSLLDTAAIDSPTTTQSALPHHPNTRSPNNSGSSGFAPPVTSTVPVASLHDISPFFSRSEPEGSLPELPIDEIESLNSFFAIRSTQRSSARVEIDHAKTFRKQQFMKLCKEVFKIPIWLKDALFRKIALSSGMSESAPLNYTHVKKFHDACFGRLTPNRRLFELLKQNSRTNYLTLDDFANMTRYLVESHSGLEFLKQPEFQEFYCKTVAIRIVYTLEVKQSKRVLWQHFDRSDLGDVIRELDQVADINQVLRYFSYEHFYVLYCRFWELDTDRDQLLSLNDLKNYSQNAVSNFVLARVISGAGRKPSCSVPHKMDFEDFVYFCLSEEDKNTPSAVLYWFKVLDLDCDCVLSGYELGKCFEENQRRFAEIMGEELKFEDMLCQMLDMVGANKIKLHTQGLTLADLKSCPTPANFFNMLFNVTKFLAFEHRDPFFEHQQKLQPEKTDWDRFARQEYDRMASEVGQ
jgi:hypothetical protein